MTPFRDKKVKWKENDSTTGRYKNVSGFKFDIIKQTIVRQPERMPKHFLADTPEEAEVLYRQYSNLLNALAYNYAISTGLQKVDLFGEALIGLGRAYRDWDCSRSDDFRTYAIYRIKDALNEFARNNITSVTVPSYIKKSHAHVVKLKNIFSEYDLSTDVVLLCGKIDKKIDGSNRKRCVYLVDKLNKAATRAKVTYKKFVERVEYIPEDSMFDDSVSYDGAKSLETTLMLRNLQTYMDPTELSICCDIMKGFSYDEIGNKFNKNSVWVRRKLDKLRDKIIASWS
jgi:RNA polymerase sigma factor (sigma-70 family)